MRKLFLSLVSFKLKLIMKFENLEERMLYFRGLTDYKLMPNSYVLIMLDGKSFSSTIKKYFKLPYDDVFINIMNEVAIYLCNKIQGCKFAYTQSDEITLVVTDFDTPETDSFFSYRLNKILPICASMAATKFMQLMTIEAINRATADNDAVDVNKVISDMKLYEFDCKAWNVPSYNDVFSFLLYRQNDCTKNSKQQAARTYLSHKTCVGITADDMISLLKKEHDIDWTNDYDDGKKYGRFIYKEPVKMISEQYGEFTRNKFMSHNAWVLNSKTGKELFEKVANIPTF